MDEPTMKGQSDPGVDDVDAIGVNPELPTALRGCPSVKFSACLDFSEPTACAVSPMMI